VAGHVASMTVRLEDTLKSLGGEDRLRWDGAINHANYYHEATNGFYDGVAACLDVLADRFEKVKAEGADSAFFIRDAANELWSLTGEGRNWQSADRLPQATAILDVLTALEIESRKL
jgi:hypothetical protein